MPTINEFSNILILNNYLELDIFTSVSDSPVVNVDVVNNNLTDIGKIIYEKDINLTGVVITPHNLS